MRFKCFFLLNICFWHIVIADEVGDPCIPNDNFKEGTCTLYTKCQAAISEVRNKRRHSFRRCGFQNKEEIVCCPPVANRFGDSGRIADRECQKLDPYKGLTLNTHILGGVATLPGEFPHMVALGYSEGDVYKFDCGGSLLSEWYVLTAAHCIVTQDDIKPTIIRAGVLELGNRAWNETTDYQIANIILHPNYTRRAKYHDLALLRLNKQVKFNGILYAVCLETNTDDPIGNLTITGWGTMSKTKNIASEVLLKATVHAVPASDCDVHYREWRKLKLGISPEQLCAGDSKAIQDACTGDSGGPLHVSTSLDEYKLYGVTSFGRGCGSTVPGVYVRVPRYLDWIESVVWGN